MRATIDQAGRLVIPKPLREHVGLRPGEVEVTAEGSGLRIELPAEDTLQEEDGRLVIGSTGVPVSDELVRSLRDAGQR
ncbi:MAG TPA: AbrB/MazE/SpoVT family DNA-binding domain-containing protein [Solirubrobacteraceae bacterium]|nr:AbrB/MazE/SpoVT family DNA-binding domain-containing protein [Solirubrobacteraceae bacterium]